MFWHAINGWGDPILLLRAAKLWGKVKIARYLVSFPFFKRKRSDRTAFLLSILRETAEKVEVALDCGSVIWSSAVLLGFHASPMLYYSFAKRHARRFSLIFAYDNPASATDSYRLFREGVAQRLKVTPVWHLGEPESLLFTYAKETPSGWVAIGGFRSPSKASKHASYLRELVTKVKEFGVKVHGLGAGIQPSLDIVPLDSTDSRSLFASRAYATPVLIRQGKPVMLKSFKEVGEDDLPEGTSLEDLEKPALRSLITAYWALQLNQFLNHT